MSVKWQGFRVATLAWAAALPLATWIASRPQSARVPYAFAFAVYGLGAWICHQRPERSFYLWAMQMPVCARCAGIYFGAAGAIAAAYVGRLKPPATSARTLLIVAAVPTILTLAFEWTTGAAPSNWIRAIAGLPIGVAVAWVVLQAEVN